MNSNRAIRQRLFISPRAVEKQVTSIFTKLRLPAAVEDHGRVLAVLRFLGSYHRVRTCAREASSHRDSTEEERLCSPLMTAG